ncbi:DEAD/DEAH box helicase [Aerococcus sp. 1KP-2016]|uniref:SNF2-related protein n=1 Tax=Aerococcus sp. 1KP-2016 TaxID=1981982 RepID=UPI000B993BA5|nr:DEAD/DEAH box helicase [Aerococcus sp. 1KP-2016]OYQ68347.1 DNA helicase [Aerococcus sp. 1KP-2016]
MLYDFQKKIVDNSKPNFLIASDVGTGKTMMAIHHYLKFNKGEPLLIVAPPAKIKEGGWDTEIDLVSKTYGIEIDYKMLSYGVLSKNWKLYKSYYVVFDECHYVKNPTSQRGKAAYQLTKLSSNFLLLSGTPASNDIGDMINYFIMFGFVQNKTQFNKQYGIWEQKFFGQRMINQVIDYKDQGKLLSWYKSIAVSIKKDDVLDLPPIIFRTIKFKASKEYKIIAKDRVLNDKAYDNPSSLTHGLREHANTDEKLAYLQMLFEGTDNNIVIFYNYNSELDAIKEIAKDKTVFEVNGKRQQIPHKIDWGELKNSVTLVQYMAGSAGIELQYANIVVYYTPTFSFQDYAQSLGRTHRNGQNKKVTVFKFSTSETIEENVWGALANKQDFDKKLYLETKLGVK